MTSEYHSMGEEALLVNHHHNNYDNLLDDEYEFRAEARSVSKSVSISEQLPGVIYSHAEDADHMLEDLHGGGLSKLLRPGSLLSAVYTLCSISLGLGVFVLPLVFKDLGIVTGTMCVIIMGAWAYVTQVWLIRAADEAQVATYEELAEHAFGPAGKIFLAFFTAFTLMVGNAGHMKAVVQMLHDIMEWYVTGQYGKLPFTEEKKLVLYVGLLGMVLPFTTGTRISALRYISTASVMAVLITCMWTSFECMFWYWPHGNNAFSGSNRAEIVSSSWKSYASNVPAIAFAFTGTFCLFPVYSELEDKKKNIQPAVAYSSAICTAGYAVVALLGILTFGKRISDGANSHNYLYVFPPDHYVLTFLCVVLVVVITLLYPVINFPAVNALIKILGMIPGCQRFAEWSHIRITITLMGMVFVVVLNFQFKSLVTIFAFCGGWGVGCVAFVLPSAIYLKVCKNASTANKGLAFVSFIVMVTIIGAFTYVTFF